MHIQPQKNKNFDAAFLSQLFYFTMHLIIMSTLILYKNPFKSFDATSVFFILMVLFSNYLFLTVSKNPGYVPKTDSDDVIILINEDTNAQKPILQKCEICNINKPIRSKHCRTCNKCIAKYDHHCFWIGGCVGELNHRSFWLFLLVQSCVILQLLIYLLDGMNNYDYSTEINGVTVYSQEFGAYFVLFVLMGMFLLFSGGMLIFHSYLIVANLTSYEVGKKEAIPYLRKYRNRNPFDKGLFRNVWSTCFHGNQLQQWVLPELSEQPNTIWQNQYYNCC